MANIQDPGNPSGSLIAASSVTGTSVYDTAGSKLGSIYDVMLDKVSGKTQYAIMNFGGLFGIGERYHPLPWNVLHYDTGQGGYVVNLDRKVLEGAPAYDSSDSTDWDEEGWGRRVDDYYGAPTHDDLITGEVPNPLLGKRAPLI